MARAMLRRAGWFTYLHPGRGLDRKVASLCSLGAQLVVGVH